MDNGKKIVPKYYTGNIMMCINYKKDSEGKDMSKSTVYIEDAFLYRLSDGSFFHIEDGPDGELVHFITLVPEEAVKQSGDVYKTTPGFNFDMFIDEKSLKPFLMKQDNKNSTK